MNEKEKLKNFDSAQKSAREEFIAALLQLNSFRTEEYKNGAIDVFLNETVVEEVYFDEYNNFVGYFPNLIPFPILQKFKRFMMTFGKNEEEEKKIGVSVFHSYCDFVYENFEEQLEPEFIQEMINDEPQMKKVLEKSFADWVS